MLQSPIHRCLPDPVWHPHRFGAYAKTVLEPLIHKTARQRIDPVSFTRDKTFVYPVAQFDILLGQPQNRSWGEYEFESYTSTEKPSLIKILQSLTKIPELRGSSWTFTAGYFNIDPDISELLIDAAPAGSAAGAVSPASLSQSPTETPASCTVITASPWANGFFGSAGISGMLPAAYTLLSRRFLRSVAAAGRESNIQLKEWRRGTVGEPNGWTYHAKGLWITLPKLLQSSLPLLNNDIKSLDALSTEGRPLATPSSLPVHGIPLQENHGPCLTLIGSSNYTKRSYSLDLEVGAVVVTGDAALQRRLQAETDRLQEDAVVVTGDDLSRVERRVGLQVRIAMWLVEKVGGAL